MVLSIREGCLKSECAPPMLDLKAGNLPFVVEDQDRARYNRRWDLLNLFDSAPTQAKASTPKELQEFDTFGKSVHRMMDNPQIGKIVKLDEAERKAYGSSRFGDSCLLARNMVAAEAGAKFVLLTQGDWDHHSNIYGKDGKGVRPAGSEGELIPAFRRCCSISSGIWRRRRWRAAARQEHSSSAWASSAARPGI